MRRTRTTLYMMALALIAVTLLVGTPAFAEDLNWVGCGISKKAFMGALAKQYEQKTGVKINLEGGGATRGIRDVALGKADIGGSCRHVIIDDSEKNAKLVHVAWDALVVIAHPTNPVTDITEAQLKDVFDGKITNWKELGGPDMPINVLVRKGKTSGVGLMVRELLFKDPNKVFTSKAIELKSSGPLEQMVEKDKGAIGFTGVSSAKKRNVKMLSVNGKTPSQENIASGDYILYRPLYLVTDRTPSKAVQDFIDFAKSDEGQAIISGEGTVNLKEGSKLWKPYNKAMKDLRINSGNY